MTILWWEFNHKMVSDLTELKRKASGEPASERQSQKSERPSQHSQQRQSLSSNDSSGSLALGSFSNLDDAALQSLQTIIGSEKFQSVLQNLNICQDAMMKIKRDLMTSADLRDRRQLETILLHLLDAIRCHTDGADILHEVNETRARRRRSGSSRGTSSAQPSPTSPTSASSPTGTAGGASSLGGTRV